MNNEQKEVLVAAKAAEATVVLVELDDAQTVALKYLEISEQRDSIAASAFSSVLRGKVQSAMDRAIKAKYIADAKNKPAVAAECEREIQKLLAMKRSLEA